MVNKQQGKEVKCRVLQSYVCSLVCEDWGGVKYKVPEVCVWGGVGGGGGYSDHFLMFSNFKGVDLYRNGILCVVLANAR